MKPLPDSVIDRVTDPFIESLENDDDLYEVPDRAADKKPVDVRVGPRPFSRDAVCSAVASVAAANNLPVPFFANLIWQESSFNSSTISRAGAQGIAQFMPKTAVEFGLINPFEPIHALNVAGKFVRELHQQFGNLGLAAAAYNAGPRRVSDWLAKRGELPGETRNYVIRITGRPAEEWTGSGVKNSPEALLMPAKAPCTEVAQAVEAQIKSVRLARLMNELAAAAMQTRDKPDAVASDDAGLSVDAGWRSRALRVVKDVLKHLHEKQVAERGAAKSRIKASLKVAAREFNRDEDRAPARNARKSEARAPEKPTGRDAIKAADKNHERPAAKADGKDTDKSASRDGAKDGEKPDVQAKPAVPRRTGSRAARFAYTHSLDRPF